MKQSFKILLNGLLFVAFEQSASAANLPPAEAAVKATFIVKFTSYINWPTAALPAGQPIVICVLGPNPFGLVLDRASFQQGSKGRRIVVRQISSITQISTCHLAYLAGRNVPQAVSSARSDPVVTITDARVSNVKGVIHFQIVAGKVKFDIDDTAARTSGLGISSQLLSLARSVRSERSR